jgi:C-terminal processing protease CtpA/Prc/Tol biopolymer transport system component
MKQIFVLVIAIIWLSPITSQSQIQLLRGPALNSDGSKVAFSFQGDIWTSDIDGGEVKRLTIHEAYEGDPQWSPDDSQIAFTSERHGNKDIFVINANGSALQRLNYHSAEDYRPKWSKDNRIIFSTKRNFAQVERNYEIYSISTTGDTPQRILDAVGNYPTISPNGRLIAFVRGTCRTTREAYRGPANREVWVYDTLLKKFQNVSQSSAQDFRPDFGDDNTLYYLSAESGRYNIHKIELTENGVPVGKPKQITNYKKEGIRNFDVSADGKSIVFEYGSDIYFKKERAKAKKMDFSLPEDFRFYPTEKKNLKSEVSDYSLSPDEKYISFVARGEVFIKKNDKDKKNAINISNSASRELQSAWLNDSTLIYISDLAGNYDLYLAQSSDPNQKDLYKTFKRTTRRLTNTPEDELGFELSPDHKQICLNVGRGKLTVGDIDENGIITNSKTLLDGWSTPYSVSWSPDNKWLAYSLQDLNFNSEVYIHAADNSMEPVNISLHPRYDYRPVWSEDGSKLGFISMRNYADADIWFVWLSKKDWEKSKEDWELDDDEFENLENGKNKEETEKDSLNEVELITIDFNNIHKRLRQVTRLPGNETNLQIDKEGETFYFTTNSGSRMTPSGKPELKSIKWDGSDEKTILENGRVSDLKWDKKGKNLYGIQSGKVVSIKVDGGKLEPLPHLAKMTIDRAGERKQIFEELWRSLNANFYDPDFHGQDFEKLKLKYQDRILNASTTQDFRDMVNEMLGQINASHMGLYSTPNPEQTQADKTGYLGVELVPVAQGVNITHIIPNSPADKDQSKLLAGDIITRVNGEAITENINFFQLLDEARNERLLLDILSVDGSQREVVIRPTNSVSTLLYEEWIASRQKLTTEYSNGRLGYIHVQSMDWKSFERFERELMASGNGKEGIVIDVRFNGGGWTTDLLMAILDVRQHAYTIPRGAVNSLKKEHKNFKSYYPFSERLPSSWWTKPSIAMCNEYSYSNAEIFSHAYKTLGIGTLVGKPTFGAVISTGARTLIDGSYVRLPNRGWFVKTTGQNMDFEPAVPDIEVENQPDSRAKGDDPQLKAAVDELLRQIDNK